MQTRSATRSSATKPTATKPAIATKPVMTKPMATKPVMKKARSDMLTVREAANIMMSLSAPTQRMQTRTKIMQPIANSCLQEASPNITFNQIKGRGCNQCKQVQFADDEEDLASMSDDDSSYAPSEVDDEGFADF
jgi:predicted nucleic acid-binding Zn ribbon protein